MSTEESKALIRRYFEAIDAECESGNADADMLDEFLAADMVTQTHRPTGDVAACPYS